MRLLGQTSHGPMGPRGPRGPKGPTHMCVFDTQKQVQNQQKMENMEKIIVIFSPVLEAPPGAGPVPKGDRPRWDGRYASASELVRAAQGVG